MKPCLSCLDNLCVREQNFCALYVGLILHFVSSPVLQGPYDVVAPRRKVFVAPRREVLGITRLVRLPSSSPGKAVADKDPVTRERYCMCLLGDHGLPKYP